MNSWKPFSEQEIIDLIKESELEMSDKEIKFWNSIKIQPEKWKEETYGKEGGGFWVVAIIGKSVLWYNDIEHGFNPSRFSEYGKIDEYLCNQDDLVYVIRRFGNSLGLNENTSIK